jgi:hypothetical protein
MKKPIKYNIPKGAYCDHRNMKYHLCEGCKKYLKKHPEYKGDKYCAAECHYCGLGWMVSEDVYGYYYCKKD